MEYTEGAGKERMMDWGLWIAVICLSIASMLNRISINENSRAIMHLWNRMDEEGSEDNGNS